MPWYVFNKSANILKVLTPKNNRQRRDGPVGVEALGSITVTVKSDTVANGSPPLRRFVLPKRCAAEIGHDTGYTLRREILQAWELERTRSFCQTRTETQKNLS